MVVAGVVLAVVGLIVAIAQPSAPWGMNPLVLGLALLAVGLVLGALGLRKRARERAKGTGPVGNPVQRMRAFPRLLRARKHGYTGLSLTQPAQWLLAVVYLVSPIDLLPELLPLIGVTDDAGVLLWLLTNTSDASGRYLRWERGRSPETAGRGDARKDLAS
ncbi:YkvA family protein [Actinokineospora guangxiensis]|uniref:YkvA family protein n=1 Tax=Actinokineospora guangxiensis TaxID=1490288 RepID=A0ABW0EST4_9PSEU